MPRQSKDTVATLGIDIGKNTFLYVSPCGCRKVATPWHAEWSVAKRRVPWRATARTLVPSRAEPIRREQPNTFRAPILIGKHLRWTCAPVERPQPMPSGETRLRAPVQGPDGVAVARVYACTIAPGWRGLEGSA